MVEVYPLRVISKTYWVTPSTTTDHPESLIEIHS